MCGSSPPSPPGFMTRTRRGSASPARCARRVAAATASSAARPSRSSTSPAAVRQAPRLRPPPTGTPRGGAPARPLDQGDAQAALELADRPGQRRLRDAQPPGGAAEVQFLSECDEVAEFPGLDLVHTSRVSIVTQPVLATWPPG